MYKCRNDVTRLLISVIKILRKIALSVEGWSHCLTIVSLCSNIIVDIPSIVPLYKHEKKKNNNCAAATQRTHSRFQFDRPRAISLFSAKYTKVNARSNFCLEPSEKKEGKKIRGTSHQMFAYELALEYFFTILWPKHLAPRRKRRYSLRVCATRIDRGKLIL